MYAILFGGFQVKLSQFTVVVNDYPETGQHLLYNTLSRALIQVEKQEWDVLQKLSTDLPIENQSRALLEPLRNQGFLVPKETKEGERFLEYLNQSSNQKGGEVSVTLLTNLQRCPLACGYCYQQGTHLGGRLEGDLSDECITFIKGQCEKIEAERLFISYYGSEPLSNLKAIVSTATELKRFCGEKEISFRFGMVTSGVLLTREVVETLRPLGFTQVQITVDGNQQTHDASRPFQSGKGTYTTIMKNLGDYAGLIRTDVLCVLNESRVDAAYELIDTLADKGYAERKVRMTFSPVMESNDNETIAASQLYVDEGHRLAAEREMLVEIAKLSIYAAKRGLFEDLLPKHTWCAMQRHDERNFTLEPSGKLYTCATFIGRDAKYEAGSIFEGFGGIDTVLKESYQRSEKCLSCRYLPICADCRVEALHQKGEITEANPKEEEYDLIVPELIKAHYKATVTGNG